MNYNKLVFLFLFLTILSCRQNNEKLRELTLTSSKNIWCTLPIIAKEKGFFKEENLDVTINYVQIAKFSMDALISSSTDIAMVVDINLAYLGFTGNENVELIATTVNAFDGAIVARKDSGIESPKDLKNKKIGVLQGTTSQIFADKFLKKHSVDSAEIINLQPVSIQTSVVSKEIDGGSIWQPFIHNISKELGENAVVFKDPEAYTGYMNVAVRKDWRIINTEKTESFLRALKKAENFVKNNPKSAKEIISKEINLDYSIVDSIWDEYSFNLYFDKEELKEVVTKEGEWILESQSNFANKELPSYDKYFNDKLIQEIIKSKSPVLNDK